MQSGGRNLDGPCGGRRVAHACPLGCLVVSRPALLSVCTDDTPGQFFYFYFDFYEWTPPASPEARIDVDGSLRHTLHSGVFGHLMWPTHRLCFVLNFPSGCCWYGTPLTNLFAVSSVAWLAELLDCCVASLARALERRPCQSGQVLDLQGLQPRSRCLRWQVLAGCFELDTCRITGWRMKIAKGEPILCVIRYANERRKWRNVPVAAQNFGATRRASNGCIRETCTGDRVRRYSAAHAGCIASSARASLKRRSGLSAMWGNAQEVMTQIHEGGRPQAHPKR